MKIAVVNDIHVGKALTYNNIIRASSHLIEDRLEYVLQQIQSHSPDLLINLGDLIRSDDKEKDLTSYSKLISHFSKLQSSVIHLLGNHEIKKMTENEIENIWHTHGFNQKSFGCKNICGFNLIWLGLQMDPKNKKIRSLPNEQLSWLEEQLKHTDLPTLIFSHCPLDDHDTTGNFFYEAMDNKSKEAFFLDNQENVLQVISSYPHVKAVIQAHLHYFNVKVINQVPYITCPAMGDNICGPNTIDNIPEIYTLITIDNEKLSVKSYSREYCFSGYEKSYT